MISGAVMDMPSRFSSSSLVDRLRWCAEQWCEANSATLARLGRCVVNDGGFFGRVSSPEASTTTATLEKFARFLGDPANWPDGAVPDDVCAFVHIVGVSARAPAPATGQADDLSGGVVL